ncbi:hypothetical protein HNR26_004611 [Rhizobium rosettiformans]|uniref:DUF2958 domain-containing protein n=2 Tax=Rhizobium rosettiformans TaxID=1368430 RepID=A0A4S8PSD9_9HYPH|nr:DUF2958 domain-containing protein [Rhizobium rosettiformans]MBB5278510.1 hypothetical protein [Rhizobium rosettiformans]THV31074.1 DUF2958 domain-containing protein [Rhizobium rosettiformans W3]
MPRASLLTAAILRQLLLNGQMSRSQPDFDPVPVVKLFTPDASATWLLTELNPDNSDLAFGLCDLGLGSPELGYVSLAEIARIRGRLRLPVERDRWFCTAEPLSVHLQRARQSGRIAA